MTERNISGGKPPTAGVKGTQPTAKAGKRPGRTFDNVADYIEAVYLKKGRPVAVKDKDRKIMAENRVLDPESQARIRDLAEKDRLLAIPAQLLLASRPLLNFPAIKLSLQSFVRETLKNHPISQGLDIEAFMDNRPEALPPKSFLRDLIKSEMNQEEAKRIGLPPLKPKELEALIINCCHALVVWLALFRDMPVAKLSELLFETVWWPKAQALKKADLLEQMIRLTPVEGVGLACNSFYEQFKQIEKSVRTYAQKSESWERSCKELEEEAQIVRNKLNTTQAELDRLKADYQRSMADTQERYEFEILHHRNGYEQLRTRLIRKMNGVVEYMGNGVQALDNPFPKPEVALDRLKRAAIELASEIKRLQSDGVKR